MPGELEPRGWRRRWDLFLSVAVGFLRAQSSRSEHISLPLLSGKSPEAWVLILGPEPGPVRDLLELWRPDAPRASSRRGGLASEWCVQGPPARPLPVPESEAPAAEARSQEERLFFAAHFSYLPNGLLFHFPRRLLSRPNPW